MIEVQTTGLTELTATLSKAASRALPEAAAVLGKGSLNIKRDWQQRWSGLGHAPALPWAISYDVLYTFGGIRSEIGPDKGKKQGPLGNLLEFGSVNNAPTPGGAPALAAEGPGFEQAIANLGDRLLQ